MGIYFIIICMGKNIYARDLFLDFNDRQKINLYLFFPDSTKWHMILLYFTFILFINMYIVSYVI